MTDNDESYRGPSPLPEPSRRGRPAEALVPKNLTIDGKRTSVRLEPKMWAMLEQICQREGLTRHRFAELVKHRLPKASVDTPSDDEGDPKRRGKDPAVPSLTSALRSAIAIYYYTMAMQEAPEDALLSTTLAETANDLVASTVGHPDSPPGGPPDGPRVARPDD